MEQTYTGGTADKKIKTHFARIIVSEAPDTTEPYFSIMYYDPGTKVFYDGYGSYKLSVVQGWMKQYFEVEGINDPLAYTKGMTFGDAIQAAKLGKRIARKGWNGKEQYVELGTDFTYRTLDGDGLLCYHEDIDTKALVFVGTRGRQVGWLASQADMLADDWKVLPEGTDMSWSEAEEMLKAGAAVRRKGWKSGLWVTIPVYPAAHWGCVCRTDKNEGNVTVGWEPEDEDLAANDWYTVLAVPVTE